MRNKKGLFILSEAVLAVMVLVLAFIMIRENREKDLPKVSVIISNSDDNQWSGLKYGFRMAAEDQGIEVLIVSTEGILTLEEEKSLIEQEIDNGADGIIVQPVPGTDTEEMLKKIQRKVPVMLVEYTASGDRDSSVIPTTKPDHYAMGMTLAEELLNDYNGKIAGKTLGIVSETADSEADVNRRKGFENAVKDTGVEIRWIVSGIYDDGNILLKDQPKVDFVIALDDKSLITAGKCSAAHDLHGALLYGIGTSAEAVYYLDTGIAECLVVPDEFNVGYRSLTEVAQKLGHYFGEVKNQTVSFTVIRRDELFSKENQEILFIMNQ